MTENPLSMPSRDRRAGSVLVAFLSMVIVAMALAGATSLLVADSVRSVNRSKNLLRARVLAGSGAQIGNALLRSTGPDAEPRHFTETIGEHDVDVAIDLVEDRVYDVTGSAIVAGEEATTRLRVIFDPPEVVGLLAGMQISVAEGVEVEGNFRVAVLGESKLNGFDHDASGSRAADQSYAVYGLGINPLPGGKTVEPKFDERSHIEGWPESTSEGLRSQEAFLRDVRDFVRENADLALEVNRKLTLGTADGDSFGSSDDPKLVYMELGVDEQVVMQEDFSGTGILVLGVGAAEKRTLFTMRDRARWNGLVLVDFRGTAEIQGGSLLQMTEDASIIGGLATFFTGNGISIHGSGRVIRTQDYSQILFSTEILSPLLTLGRPEKPVNVTTYHVP